MRFSLAFFACFILFSKHSVFAASPLCTDWQDQSRHKHLCVLQRLDNAENPSSIWLLQINQQASRSVIEPATAMWQIAEMQAQASGPYLAIVSVGEGHPILEVFLLADIEHGQAQPIYEFNPYPGWLTVRGWEKEQLIIESNASAALPPISPAHPKLGIRLVARDIH